MFPHHIETSQLISSANQQTGFYMKRTLVVKGSSKSITYIPKAFILRLSKIKS